MDLDRLQALQIIIFIKKWVIVLESPDGQIERCDNVKDVAGSMERIDEMIERKRRLFED